MLFAKRMSIRHSSASESAKDKKSLIICFENYRFLKSYCNEILLKELSNKFELIFLLPEKFVTSQTKHMELFGVIVKFRERKILGKISRLILARETFMNQKLSVSFETRIKMI